MLRSKKIPRSNLVASLLEMTVGKGLNFTSNFIQIKWFSGTFILGISEPQK